MKKPENPKNLPKPASKDWPLACSPEELAKVLADEDRKNEARLKGKPPVAVTWPE